MTKYEPLTHFLQKKGFSEVPMTFREVEKVIGAPLPRSANIHRPWWANEARGHVHAKAWLDAGYETAQVDMSSRKLVFRRITGHTPNAGTALGLSDNARTFEHANAERKPRRHPLFGAMKGTFTLVPPGDDDLPPEDPESWEALTLAKLDRLLFGKGE